jgi:leucine dehydrogenase
MGLRAAVAKRLGRSSVAGLRVAVQGLGNVGRELAGLLSQQGAELIVSDIHDQAVEEAVRELGARSVAPDAIYDAEADVFAPCRSVAPDAIYDAEADVFAPCALGAILNDDTIARLRAKVVAGSANNQLADDRHGDALKARGILYAPDYVINAGGLIYVSGDARKRNGAGFDHDAALARVAGIQDTLTEVFARAKADDLATSAAADRIAEERFKGPSPRDTVAPEPAAPASQATWLS